jgi:hypothetical protein
LAARWEPLEGWDGIADCMLPSSCLISLTLIQKKKKKNKKKKKKNPKGLLNFFRRMPGIAFLPSDFLLDYSSTADEQT